MKIADYLSGISDCPCGKDHRIDINTIEVASGSLTKIADLIRQDGFTKPFIIADCNTHKVAGERLLELLAEAEINFSSYVFADQELIPDEMALGKLGMNYDPTCDLVIAVGSGTLNDLSRFFSHRLGLPYYIVATAPSMDGYASSGAALIRNNLKTTFECQMPRAIIADLDVIRTAPKEMIAAGFGDVIGKYTCLADWKLSAIINGEYYCDQVVEMTRKSLERTVSLQEGIAQGDPEAIGGLMEALLMAGIGMSYVGNSRPASGSEHHLSHFWEMRFQAEGKKAIFHGTKVGIATVLMARLYQFLSEEEFDEKSIASRTAPYMENWESGIREAFLAAAPGVFQLEEETQKNSLSAREERIKVIATKWPQIREVLDEVPAPEQVIGLIRGAGGAVNSAEVGINAELVRQGVLYAKEVRPRYTMLQLLWDLDLLAEYATRV